MSESKQRLKAVTIVKIDDMLAQTYELEIEDGKLVGVKQLTKAEDLPAVAIGLAQRELWVQYRSNREVPSVKAKS
jgi:hypothetical protein